MPDAGRRAMSRGSLCVSLVIFVAGCTVGPAYERPQFSFAKSYAAASAGTPVLLKNDAWWKKFDDPTLNELIREGLGDNLDLALARERVIEAQALADTIPEEISLTGNAKAGRGGGRNVADGREADASFGLSWLLDPYGGRRAQIEAAGARVEVADARRDAARLLLLSNIATAYVDLRFYEQSLKLRRQELQSRRKTLDLVQQLQQGSAATRLDVTRAEALVSQTRAQMPGIRTAIRAQHNRIAVLLGRTPGQPVRALQGSGRGQPVSGMPSNIGIPADLLRNRPDIRVAERLYYAAVSDIGTARADLYPALSLSGEVTLSSIRGATGMSYFLGPSLRLPALPNGSRKADVRVRESRARQALTGWQSVVLKAIEEVENALAGYAGSHTAVDAARETVRLYRKSVTLTQELIGRDGATIRDLLADEQSVATANLLLTQNVRDLGRAFIILNTSLGSGSGYAQENMSAALD